MVRFPKSGAFSLAVGIGKEQRLALPPNPCLRVCKPWGEALSSSHLQVLAVLFPLQLSGLLGELGFLILESTDTCS